MKNKAISNRCGMILPFRLRRLRHVNDRRARHECVQVGATHFFNLLTVLTLFIKIILFCRRILAYVLNQTAARKIPFRFFNPFQRYNLDNRLFV